MLDAKKQKEAEELNAKRIKKLNEVKEEIRLLKETYGNGTFSLEELDKIAKININNRLSR